MPTSAHPTSQPRPTQCCQPMSSNWLGSTEAAASTKTLRHKHGSRHQLLQPPGGSGAAANTCVWEEIPDSAATLPWCCPPPACMPATQALQLDLSGATVAYYSLPALAVLVSGPAQHTREPGASHFLRRLHTAEQSVWRRQTVACAVVCALVSCCVPLTDVVVCRGSAWLCCKGASSTWQACSHPSTFR